MRHINEDYKPVYFRPGDVYKEAATRNPSDMVRYDDATKAMVPDDGKTPSMAFAYKNFVLYARIPNYENLLSSWPKKPNNGRWLERHEDRWCFQTRDGTPNFGEQYADHDEHPNVIAEQTARRWAGDQHWGAINGRGMDIDSADEQPPGVECALCRSGKHTENEVAATRTEYEYALKRLREQAESIQEEIKWYEAALGRTET